MLPIPIVNLESLPTEVLLEILTLSWSHTSLSVLKLISRRFSCILTCYEHSIASDLIEINFPWKSQQVFPGMCWEQRNCYTTVEVVRYRWQALERIELIRQSMKVHIREQPWWTVPRWHTVQRVGLCLLFRLYDCGRGIRYHLSG